MCYGCALTPCRACERARTCSQQPCMHACIARVDPRWSINSVSIVCSLMSAQIQSYGVRQSQSACVHASSFVEMSFWTYLVVLYSSTILLASCWYYSYYCPTDYGTRQHACAFTRHACTRYTLTLIRGLILESTMNRMFTILKCVFLLILAAAFIFFARSSPYLERHVKLVFHNFKKFV